MSWPASQQSLLKKINTSTYGSRSSTHCMYIYYKYMPAVMSLTHGTVPRLYIVAKSNFIGCHGIHSNCKMFANDRTEEPQMLKL